mmetsp:Transcript_27361/g.37741  ORF Transcript_27361/g.37741 Transcript_27361/m.37741 type:complete len:95 (+) Transcript_27361:372-656(+)
MVQGYVSSLHGVRHAGVTMIEGGIAVGVAVDMEVTDMVMVIGMVAIVVEGVDMEEAEEIVSAVEEGAGVVVTFQDAPSSESSFLSCLHQHLGKT